MPEENEAYLNVAADYKYTFINMQAGKGGELPNLETSIITGAMDLTEKTVRDAMTPISQTFSLDTNSKLDM